MILDSRAYLPCAGNARLRRFMPEPIGSTLTSLMSRILSSGWRSRLDLAMHPRFLKAPTTDPHASSSLAEGHPPVHVAAIPSVPFNTPTTEPLASRLTAVVPDAQEESC
jgi:hypothetical protein